MEYKATVSFAGTVTMAQNEVRDLEGTEANVIADLLQAGYIIAEKPVNKAKKAKAKVVADENK